MKVFIYILKDPITMLPRYVGKSNELRIKKRLYEHCQLSRMKRNNHRNNWIKKLLSANLKPILRIIAESDEMNFSYLEKYWIRCYTKLGITLTNSSVGGEGSARFKNPRVISNQQREQISRTLKKYFKQPEHLKQCSEAGKKNRGKKKSRNTSGYPGVRKLGNRWCAYLNLNYKQKYLGLHKTIEEAAEAYNLAVTAMK